MSERARAALRALADAMGSGFPYVQVRDLRHMLDDDALWSEPLVVADEGALRDEMHSHSPIVGVEGKTHGIVGCFCDKSTRSETFNFEHHMYQSVIAAGVVQKAAQVVASLAEKWSGCWCGPQQREDHDPRVRDCPQHGSDDCRHMAEGIGIDLRALAAPADSGGTE